MKKRAIYIRRSSAATKPVLLLRPMMKLAGVVLLLWLLPLPLFYFFVGDFHFWQGLALFFTKTAFVTIGGSYTVIPFVAQVAVVKLHWLSRLQMMDGFALAETTPGPLIVVVAFVGDAVVARLKLEALFGGPEDRVGVEGVREVEEFAGEGDFRR